MYINYVLITMKLKFLAIKLAEKTCTEPLKKVPLAELAVSFQAIAVDV